MSRTWLAAGSQHRASTQAAMSSTLVPHSGCYQSRSKVQAWPWNNLDFQHGRLSLSPHSLSSRADLSLPPLTLSPRHQQVAIPSQSPMSLRKAKPPRSILSCKASGPRHLRPCTMLWIPIAPGVLLSFGLYCKLTIDSLPTWEAQQDVRCLTEQ